jgi:hypothetical protein
MTVRITTAGKGGVHVELPTDLRELLASLAKHSAN